MAVCPATLPDDWLEKYALTAVGNAVFRAVDKQWQRSIEADYANPQPPSDKDFKQALRRDVIDGLRFTIQEMHNDQLTIDQQSYVMRRMAEELGENPAQLAEEITTLHIQYLNLKRDLYIQASAIIKEGL